MSPVDQFPGNIFFLFYRRLIFPQEIRKKEEFQDEENNEELDQDNQPEKFSQSHVQETFPVKIVDIPYVRLHFSLCLQAVSAYYSFPKSESDILFLNYINRKTWKKLHTIPVRLFHILQATGKNPIIFWL